MKRLTKIVTQINTDWKECVNNFILLKSAEGLSQRTIDDYKYHLCHFFNKYGNVLDDYEALKKAVLEYFAESSELAADTFNIRRKYLKCFFAWCLHEGIIPANPLDTIHKKKSEGRIRPIDTDTLEALLKLPDKNTYAGLRDYTLMLLSLDTGIRPSEALALTVDDVNLKSQEIYIREEVAKTRVSRTLPILKETALSLAKLIAITQKTWDTKNIFYTCEGNPMTINVWKQRMWQYSKKLGKPISAYDLRHAFAIMYLRNGGDAFTLQRLMGHTDMEMTKRYLKFSQTDLQNAHQTASPLNRLLPKKRRVRNIKPRD
ncbi:site-specific integrase [Thermoanaerobacteraceae bacterium SP2]|nr:site-specific integrase [Thermoanaerobacteraceae bacterium SP2]